LYTQVKYVYDDIILVYSQTGYTTHLSFKCNMRWPHLWTKSEHTQCIFYEVSTTVHLP